MITKIKNNKTLIYMMLPFLIIITLITAKIIMGKELIIDKIAHNILIEQFRTPALTTFMKLITKLGNTSVILSLAIIFTLLFMIKWKDKTTAKLISCNLIMIACMNQVLKFIFQRERPIGYRLIEITGYSFPSGHAMVSMAFYGLLIYIIYKRIKNKKIRNILIGINSIIILLIGISRIYLGVHYLSDVLTGYSISIIYLILLVKFLKKYKLIP